jgi:hypothetical protein
MERKGDDYIYWTMCPPGETLYFFTVNGKILLQEGEKKSCLLEVKVIL